MKYERKKGNSSFPFFLTLGFELKNYEPKFPADEPPLPIKSLKNTFYFYTVLISLAAWRNEGCKNLHFDFVKWFEECSFIDYTPRRVI